VLAIVLIVVGAVACVVLFVIGLVAPDPRGTRGA
jgi:NADH:ubiquinone oxidoreductase subunit 6 (subunit J)